MPIFRSNLDLRVSFLVGEIDEAALKVSIQKREKSQDKKQELREVCSTLVQAGGAILMRGVAQREQSATQMLARHAAEKNALRIAQIENRKVPHLVEWWAQNRKQVEALNAAQKAEGVKEEEVVGAAVGEELEQVRAFVNEGFAKVGKKYGSRAWSVPVGWDTIDEGPAATARGVRVGR